MVGGTVSKYDVHTKMSKFSMKRSNSGFWRGRGRFKVANSENHKGGSHLVKVSEF